MKKKRDNADLVAALVLVAGAVSGLVVAIIILIEKV